MGFVHFSRNTLIVTSFQENGNGVLFRFNPITGQASEGGLLQLNYKIKQLALLPETEEDYVKGILILDGANKVHVEPKHATPLVNTNMLCSECNLTRIHLNHCRRMVCICTLPI